MLIFMRLMSDLWREMNMSSELLTLMRPELVAMNAYCSARSERSKDQNQTDEVWLDANENPWEGMPGKQYNRYPEPQPYSLTTLFSSLYAVDSEQLLITRGSDEGIDLLTRLFCCARQDQIMICPPTYGMYKVAATIQGVGVVEVPLVKTKDFSLDLNGVFEKWQPNIKLVFLCSPNNPTGNLLASSDVLTICRQLKGKAIVIVDEAYIEFSLADSLSKYLNDYPNLVILRTLSKAYGLAGVRCGTIIANPIIIQSLKKIIAPYPVSKAVVDVVSQQLDLGSVRKQVELINQEKEKLRVLLVKLPFVKKVWKSSANFLLFEVSDSQRVMEVCFKYGVVLRDRSREYDLKNCIRVTVGSPKENKLFMETLGYVAGDQQIDRGLCASELTISQRFAKMRRTTSETDIYVAVNLDQNKKIQVSTGIGFFDHMLEQMAKHGGFSLEVTVMRDDLFIDEHHTVEDTAIVLGGVIRKTLGDKLGINRYGFLLPMDEALAHIAIDLSGRGVLVFDGEFTREKVGEMPTEVILHFFRSFAESLGAAIHIKVTGENTHHMIESIFKGVGRALKQAIHKDGCELPSTKGVL